MKKISILVLLSVLPVIALPMAQWDQVNNPDLMNINYERNFSKLPLSGKLKTAPWSDDYWATFRGGITYRWNQPIPSEDREFERWSYDLINDPQNVNLPLDTLSPAEKYDLFLGRMDFPLTRFERQRTKIMKTVPGSKEYEKDFKIPEWEGLCHAWAPATLFYKNSGPITVTGKLGHKIPFGSSDLHALLTYHLHINKSPRTYFIGSRCLLSFEELEKKLKENKITQAEFDKKINSSKCKDINAGAFHMALANQIALLNQGFVADITRDQEVWNQPVYSYESEILEDKKEASEGSAPGTVREITLKTKMGYVQEIVPTFEALNDLSYFDYEEYEYKIELDGMDKIIGGEWISFNRPDFIWRSQPVKFQGYFKDLQALYLQSIEYLKRP